MIEKSGLLISTALLLAMSGPAFAQEAAPTAAEQDGIQDIVVTAERREASLQRVPISITALPTKTLEQKQITDVIALNKVVPGLQAKPTLSPLELSIAIRGVTQLIPSINVDPAIGSYIDGVYNVLNAGSNTGMIDMERVEVLKGPQGTLFGRNTIGGAISITTAKPTSELGGYVEGSYGNYNAWTTTGVVNLPVAPGTLDTRIVYQHSEHDGYGHNFTTGTPTATFNQDYVRGTAQLTGERIEATVTGFYVNAHGYGTPTSLASFDPAAALPGVPVPTSAFIPLLSGKPGDLLTNYVRRGGSYDSYGDLSDRFALRQYGVTGTASLELDEAVSIKSISGYTDTRYDTVADLDGTPYTFLHIVDYPIHAQQFSEEVQFFGNALDDRLKWIAGGYYFSVKGDQTSKSIALGALGRLSPPYFATTINANGPTVHNRSTSAFAQLTYEVIPDLRITGGIRYVKDKRTVSYRDKILIAATGAYAGCALANYPGGSDPALCLYGRSAKYNYTPWTIGVDYAPRPGMLVYAKLSKGFRSGAFTLFGPAGTLPVNGITAAQANAANASALSQFAPVAPEKLISPEIGAKFDLLDRRLRTNIALYYSDYSNIQQTVNGASVAGCPTCTTPALLSNSGKAEIYGGELEVTALLGKLQIEGALGYTHPKYTGGPSVGTPIINVSKLNTALSATYPIETSAGTITLGGTWSYRSRMVMYTLSPGLPEALYDTISQKGFSQFDARIAIDLANAPITIAAYGQNLANKRYIGAATSFSPPLGYTSNSPGLPRTYGLSAKYAF